MRIAFFSCQYFERSLYQQVNQSHGHELIFFNSALNKTHQALIPNVDVVCCFVSDRLCPEVIDKIAEKGIKLIALRSAGFNHVDVNYAKEKSIAVCRVPDYSPHAIAEHALALILTLNRKTHKAYNRSKEANFSLKDMMGFDLYQKTVGIIGTGKIGSAFATMMKGLGLRLLACDPQENPACLTLGVEYLPLAELLQQADIISLHCPLTAETHHIIGRDEVMNMKKGVMLINTSRGQLLETQAVIAGLKSQHIGYLGIDVYEEEQGLFFADHSNEIITDDDFCRLLSFPNVLITGHQGFFTQEAVERIAVCTLNNISCFFDPDGKAKPAML